MKRFEKLERARGEPSDPADATTPAGTGAADAGNPVEAGTAKRFAAIERARGARAPAPSDQFAPAQIEDGPVQLELHDRFTEEVESARRTRRARATQQLQHLEAERVGRQERRPAPGVLDLVIRGAAIGPLAQVGGETRLWIVAGSLLATWFAVVLTLGGTAAVVSVLSLFGLLLARGALRRA